MEPREYEAMHQAEDTHWWYRALRAIFMLLIEQFSPLAAEFSLDAGCGTGGTLRNARLGKSVVGFDASPMALRFCRRDGIPLLVRGSVNLLPFRSETFNRLASLDVLCNKSIRLHQALDEARRVLKTGGAFFTNLPAFNALMAHHDCSVHTRHRFTHGEIANLLRRAGLKPERITYWNFILFPLELTYRIVDKCFLPGNRKRSEVSYSLPILDAVLDAIARLEAGLLRRVNLPIGLSVFAVARRMR